MKDGLCFRIDGTNPCEVRGSCRPDIVGKCPRSAPCNDEGMCYTVDGKIPFSVLSDFNSGRERRSTYPSKPRPPAPRIPSRENPCVGADRRYEPKMCYAEFPCLGSTDNLCYRVDGSDPCEKRGHQCRPDVEEKCPRSTPCKDITSGLCFTLEGGLPLNILTDGNMNRNAQKHLFPGQKRPVQFHPDFEWTKSVCEDLGVHESVCLGGGGDVHLYAMDGRIDSVTNKYVLQKNNVDPFVTRPDVKITTTVRGGPQKLVVIEKDVDEENVEDIDEENVEDIDEEDTTRSTPDTLRVRDLLNSASNDCAHISDFDTGDSRIDVTKADMLFSLPNVLVVHSKKLQQGCTVSKKYFANDGIPNQLDVKQLSNDETCRFRLVSFVRWSGLTRQTSNGRCAFSGTSFVVRELFFSSQDNHQKSGHYTAGVKRNEKWYHMNDNRDPNHSSGDPNLLENRKEAVLFIYEKHQCEVDATTLRDVEDARDETTPRGLPNLGNTCWFNALMQALSSSKIFRDTVLAIRDDTVLERYREFVRLLQNIVTFLHAEGGEVNVRQMCQRAIEQFKILSGEFFLPNSTHFFIAERATPYTLETGTSEDIIRKQQDSAEMFNFLLSVLHIGTGRFNSEGSRDLAGDFVSLQDEEGAVKEPEFNIHRRDETRMRYETHLKDRYLENMRSMNSSGIDTKMCQGQSTTVDNFMHLSLQVMAIGNPNEDSPHVAPECLERESSGDPEFIRERFLCETGFLASV